jgi:phenylphosphate carboxylase gamma subunit
MKEYDTFILTDLDEVQEDVEQEMLIRDLTPGRERYRSEFVKALISSNPEKYPDRLWLRLGRGQLVGQPWSIKNVKKVNKIPERYR